MNRDFKDIVKRIFESHDLHDEKLESIITELFKEFENHLYSIDSLEKLIDETDKIRIVNEQTKFF